MGIVEAFIPVGLVVLAAGAAAGVGMSIRVLVGRLRGLNAKPSPALKRAAQR